MAKFEGRMDSGDMKERYIFKTGPTERSWV